MRSGYREELEINRMLGQAMQVPYGEHCKEVLLGQMRSRIEPAERGYEEPFMREESICEDMLLFLKREEVLERGIYSWNRPNMDLIIVAPPPLMAFILGEYALALRLCELCDMPVRKMLVDEMYQDGDRSFIGGGQYGFAEACLFSEDMSFEEKQFFYQRGCYEGVVTVGNGLGFMEGFQFHQGGGSLGELWHLRSEKAAQMLAEEIWRPIQAVQNLEKLFGTSQKLLTGVIKYALSMKLDRDDVEFWDKLYVMFREKEEHYIIVDAMHDYFRDAGSWEKFSPECEERVVKGLQAYFRYEETIPMQGAVEAFLLERLYTEAYVALDGKGRNYMERYLSAVKRYSGEVSSFWQQGMYDLLEQRDVQWLRLGIQSGFLKVDCIKDYIEYILLEHFRQGKGYSEFISRLIQLKWKYA